MNAQEPETSKTQSATKWLCPHHKSFRKGKSFDAMQWLLFLLTHFKANGTKISQKCVQCVEALSFVCCGKVPQTKHCCLWNRIQGWKSHCSISVRFNLLCCVLALRFSVLTSDKQHLHQGHNFLPWGRWEQTQCNHFK